MLSRGESVKQETKRWDPAAGKTVAMRSKEKADDYRYFPEPDMVRLSMVNEEFIEILKAELPELPDVKEKRFEQQFGLSPYDARVLTAEKPVSQYFEAVCRATNNYKSAANWVMGKVLNSVKENESGIAAFPVKPADLGSLIKITDDKTISERIAKAVFDQMVNTGLAPEKIVEQQNLRVISDENAILALVQEILNENPNQVQQFKEGKTKVMGFFIGKIMQKTQGKASPEVVNRLLKEELTR
jgi:aspartyl-tRNA(Asn)/glutamyl-tRNA(Gln) amidotransferase subunit B